MLRKGKIMEWIIGGFLLLVVIGAILKPKRCDICETYFKKNYYTWTIEGKKTTFMPKL